MTLNRFNQSISFDIESLGRVGRGVNKIGAAVNDQIRRDSAHGRTALDAGATLSGKPEEPFYHRIFSDHHDLVGRKGPETGPFMDNGSRGKSGRVA